MTASLVKKVGFCRWLVSIQRPPRYERITDPYRTIAGRRERSRGFRRSSAELHRQGVVVLRLGSSLTTRF